MAITIKDVAKAAKVSPSTVSRVISDSNHISEKTKKKVREVMEELGYHINLNARGLVQQSTKTLGIVLKYSENVAWKWVNPFVSEVLQGIGSHCHEHGYSIMITTGNTEEEIYADTVKMVQGKQVDGIIVLYAKEGDRVVPFLLEAEIPFAVIGKPVDRINEVMYVDNDNVQAAKDATEFLLSKHHQKIGFIGDNPTFQVIQDRVDGYFKALEWKGFPRDEGYVKFIRDPEDEGAVLDEFLKMKNPPTALIISSPLQGVGILKSMQENHLHVPEDMSLIVFNKTLITDLSIPKLTAVDTQTYQLGYEASRGVVELINNPDTFKRSVIIPTKIELGESHRSLKSAKPEFVKK
ncbi:LacI family DNA-binding transcriptional regulator [Oceanobacillus sp. J11TS1]|uniref:LacI family DNA-binding transcriptional regulator n=1 Tax=Oceanobacillus sp. J11TS1 TaxID=2807191 RepID=UPI001B124D13|nr:LacI family DNA-binding transcriptional regulator [Oceanobacillus sp. J11TS1]GIO23840.1 LacI family transcriptional regulator [Oceanobacillus sp. J11TS1]